MDAFPSVDQLRAEASRFSEHERASIKARLRMVFASHIRDAIIRGKTSVACDVYDDEAVVLPELKDELERGGFRVAWEPGVKLSNFRALTIVTLSWP